MSVHLRSLFAFLPTTQVYYVIFIKLLSARDHNTYRIPTYSVVDDADGGQRPIPRYNKDATSPSEVYTFDDCELGRKKFLTLCFFNMLLQIKFIYPVHHFFIFPSYIQILSTYFHTHTYIYAYIHTMQCCMHAYIHIFMFVPIYDSNYARGSLSHAAYRQAVVEVQCR